MWLNIRWPVHRRCTEYITSNTGVNHHISLTGKNILFSERTFPENKR